VLNSTDGAPAGGYSPGMSSEPLVDDGFAERWAAWQARGAAHDRSRRRTLFIIAAVVIVSVAILNGVWWS
jgi:hypothetical protein